MIASGFNTWGVLSARDYDAIVPAPWRSPVLLPGARSAVVLACGGPAFGAAFGASPEAHDARPDPVDRFTERIVNQTIARAASPHFAAPTYDHALSDRALYYWERQDGHFADFVALGRACGLGWPSRLGVLIHPDYGPWISLRAVVLTRAALAATPPLPDPSPCEACPGPCASACPGGALRRQDFDVAACGRTTLSLETCRVRCDARRACVMGREHAYSAETEALFRSAVVRIARPSAAQNPSGSGGP